MLRDEMKPVPVEAEDDAVRAVAERHETLGDGIEHRLEIGRRGRDHTEDVGARLLLFECRGERSPMLLALLDGVVASPLARRQRPLQASYPALDRREPRESFGLRGRRRFGPATAFAHVVDLPPSNASILP